MIEALQAIVHDTPGAVGTVLMGFDGICVEQWVPPEMRDKYDVESVAMEFSLRFIELRTAALSLELGEINDITIKAEEATVLVRVLSDEYFVAVLMDNAKHFGKGRWVLRQHSEELRAEIA